MTYRIPTELAERISQHLLGTCKSVDEALEAFVNELPNGDDPSCFVDEMNDRMQNEFEIQLCDECEWWCEVSELDNEGNDNVMGRCMSCR